MSERVYSLHQASTYVGCLRRIVEYLLMHSNVDLSSFERLFNDRSLILFSDNGLDEFILDFFSSAEYCQLDRCYKNLLHNDIKLLLSPKNKK